MRVQDIMTGNPACATPDMSLQDVAKMMVDCDCGAIPVIENESTGRAIGVITDRDIVIRTLGQGRNPMDMRVRDCMTESAITISMDRDIKDAARMMSDNQVRRLIVTDGNNRIIGMLAQADVAREGKDKLTGHVVEEISEPVSRSMRSEIS